MKRTYYYLYPFIIECGGRDFFHISFITSANQVQNEIRKKKRSHSIELRAVVR